MSLHRIRTIMKQNFIFYLTGLLMIFGIKYFYSKAGSDELTWILTPTTWWVSILSGISFTYESGTGYVNHNLRYIIAPSCCGVQFMIITFATLIFSFVHRMEVPGKGLPRKPLFQKKWKILWTLGCIAFSYLFTVFVNGLRIILAIYIPLFLSGMPIYNGFLTPERLHTLIGTAVYFTALLTVYHPADCLSLKIAAGYKTSTTWSENSSHCTAIAGKELLRKCISPVFWYFFIVLGIPFLNSACKNSCRSFLEYAALITGVCLSVICLLGLKSVLLKSLRHT